MKQIIFGANGDNPSLFEVDMYLEEILTNQLPKRIISNDLALDIIRLAMKQNKLKYSNYEFLICDKHNNIIYNCVFTKEFQWAEKTWKRTCTDLHKHCPTTPELDARMNILFELI